MNSCHRFISAASLLAASFATEATPAPAPACHLHASDLQMSGHPLTYARVAGARRAWKSAATGSVYVPVVLPNRREVIYAIEPNGCARRTSLARSLR